MIARKENIFMNKLLIILAVALFGLSACSKDEVENVMEVTFLFDKVAHAAEIDGAYGIIFRQVGGKRYYVVRGTGSEKFVPISRQEFPNTDIFMLNTDICVSVTGMQIIVFTRLSDGKIIHKAKLGYTDDSVGKIEL